MCTGKIEEVENAKQRYPERERRLSVSEILSVYSSGIRCFCWALRSQDEKPLVSQWDVGVLCGGHLWLV